MLVGPLLGQEAELHYHSLEPTASQNSQLTVVQEIKQKYGEGKISKEICPTSGRQFDCYSHGVFQSGEGGALQVYSNDSVFLQQLHPGGVLVGKI